MADAVARPEAQAMEEEERVLVASQWRLMWWRYKKHKLAIGATVVVAMFYLVAIGAEFMTTDKTKRTNTEFQLMPPQAIQWFNGFLNFEPHVHGITTERKPPTFKRIFFNDPDVKIPVNFFVKGYEYKFLGFFKTDRHLLGIPGMAADGSVIDEDGNPRGFVGTKRPTIYILGTDKLGRDMWSRLMIATRISMSIGLVGVLVSLVLGTTLGGISGYFGGVADTIIQRMVEILQSIPTIPLWMGLASAVPAEWSVLRVYFMITLLISLIGWTGLAREVRGRFLAMREEDFVMAARLAGAREARVIMRHMVPSFLSHIIARATLAVPFMIIAETALSFLGLGMRAPAVSWGVMLQQAQNVQTVALSQHLMLPAIPVIIVILALNFVGDGLRDAADPYG